MIWTQDSNNFGPLRPNLSWGRDRLPQMSHGNVRDIQSYMHINNLKNLKNIPGALIPGMQTSAFQNNCITFRPSVSRKFLAFCIICWNTYKYSKFLSEITTGRGNLCFCVIKKYPYPRPWSLWLGWISIFNWILQDYWLFRSWMLPWTVKKGIDTP